MSPLRRFTGHGDILQHSGGSIVGTAMANLTARQRLHRGDVPRIDLQSRAVGCKCFVDTASLLQCQRQIHPGVGMAGHEFSSPFEFVGRFV
jgi:hypothetical protein